jgi:eukaryotic-like serine/threonine-protein kinase
MKNILFLILFLLVISCSSKVPDAILKISKKDIISFSFDNFNPKIVAKIDSVTNKITAILPVGSDITKQLPTIMISEKATISPNSGTIQDFTQLVKYTVTAEDGSTKFYEVKIVAVPKSSKKDIISFSFEVNTIKVSAIIDSVKSIITATLPIGTDISKLSPTIALSEKAEVNPASGIIQDFTQSIKYTVKAEDGSTRVYDVKVDTEKPTSTVFISGGDGLCLALDAKTGKKKWEYNVGQTYIVSSPTYQDGNVYIGTLSGPSNPRFIALDLFTGKQKWVFMTPDLDEIIATPISVKGKIYLCTRNGKIYCLNTTDGKAIWQVSSNKEITSSPLIDNNLIYFVNEDGLQIYDTNNGQKKSRIATTQSVLGVKGVDSPESSPLILVEKIYFTTQGKLTSYNYKTKETESILKLNNNFRLSALHTSNNTIFTSDYQKLYAIDLNTSKLKWSNLLSNPNGWLTSQISTNDVVFLSNGGNLYAFDILSGSKKWEFQTKDYSFSSPTYYAKTIYVVSTENVFAIDAINGSLKWSVPLKSTGLGLIPSPIVINELGEVFHSAISGAQQ